MTTEIITATSDTTLEEIATMMKNEDVGAIPIVDDGELCGLVTDRDIVVRCVAEGRDPSDTRAEDICSEDLHTIEIDDDVNAAADLMARHQIRRLPVIEEGRLVGMLAIGDIAVKEGDDRTSGDTLEGVSRGVKDSGHSAGSRRQSAAKSASMHSPQKRGVASGEESRAGRAQPQHLRENKDSGHSDRRHAKSAATRDRDLDMEEQGISNRKAGEETRRNERVVPIRESRSSSHKPATRKKAG